MADLINGIHAAVILDNMTRTTQGATFGGKAKRRRMIRKAAYIAAFAAGLIVLAIVGIDRPQDDVAQYCNNVRNGVWPDYEGTFATECGDAINQRHNVALTKY